MIAIDFQAQLYVEVVTSITLAHRLGKFLKNNTRKIGMIQGLAHGNPASPRCGIKQLNVVSKTDKFAVGARQRVDHSLVALLLENFRRRKMFLDLPVIVRGEYVSNEDVWSR